jgi:hypothetical protein
MQHACSRHLHQRISQFSGEQELGEPTISLICMIHIVRMQVRQVTAWQHSNLIALVVNLTQSPVAA